MNDRYVFEKLQVGGFTARILRAKVVCVVAALMAFTGCGPDDSGGGEGGEGGGPTGFSTSFQDFDEATFENQEHADDAKTLTPPMLTIGVHFAALASSTGPAGNPEERGDCPGYVGDGDAVVITGGCTDENGLTWEGTARMEENEDAGGLKVAFPTESVGSSNSTTINPRLLEFDRFSVKGTKQCEDGTVVEIDRYHHGMTKTVAVDEDNYRFEVDLEMIGNGNGESCEEDQMPAVSPGNMRIEYTGSVAALRRDADGMVIAHQWNGQGAMADASRGLTQVETTDQAFDLETCAHEPTSGNTTLSSSGTKLEYRYDGAESCEEAAEVNWYLDGEQKGTVEDVRCSSTGAGGTVPSAAALLLIVLVRLVRRDTGR